MKKSITTYLLQLQFSWKKKQKQNRNRLYHVCINEKKTKKQNIAYNAKTVYFRNSRLQWLIFTRRRSNSDPAALEVSYLFPLVRQGRCQCFLLYYSAVWWCVRAPSLPSSMVARTTVLKRLVVRLGEPFIFPNIVRRYLVCGNTMCVCTYHLDFVLTELSVHIFTFNHLPLQQYSPTVTNEVSKTNFPSPGISFLKYE